MKDKNRALRLVFFIIIILMIFSMIACQPVEAEEGPQYGIEDDESNQANKDHTTRDQAIEKVTGSLSNLQKRLDSEEVGEGGYYMAFDFHINTQDNSNFVMKLKAHLFTWPYEDEFGNIREDDLKKHNELIKKSTILIEWYNGITNEMLIGFYYDGQRANPNDPGNILYLNLQGEKRWFPDFGDSVLYQQLIRLITSFSITDMLDKAGAGEDGGISALETLFKMAITTNYKQVINYNEELNKDITSILFDNVGLDAIREDITGLIQGIFSPFGNKIDPLTNKYLGFKFSTLGGATIQTLISDMLFYIEPDADGAEDIITDIFLNMQGSALVKNQSVPFITDLHVYYGAAPSKPIELDKEHYKYYDYGKYEFVGNLYLPTMDLNLDALIRTKVNEYDNSINHVFSEFRDIANGDLIIGAYYKNELAYLDIEGLQHLYGGIKIDDIGFPKVYIEGWDLAKTLKGFYDWVDNAIVSIVDNILTPKDETEKNKVLEVIMAKMESTEKDPADPLSKNSIMIRIDHELIKDVLREGGYGTYTTRDLINIINAQLPITLDEIATILGITSAEILLEKTWIKLTLDVDTNEITIEVFSDIGIIEWEEPSKLLMRLELMPVKIGEDMIIAEISFDDFNELLPVYTYSAEMNGQFLFSNAEIVDLSGLLSSFMDDISELNTPYILPMETKLDFTLVYDQYIREQRLQTVPGGPRDGRWMQASRSAFILNVFIKGSTPEDNVTLFNIYSDDVSFNQETPEDELGYVWVDLVCIRANPNVRTIPRFKIREDYWLQSVNRYMNASETGDNVGEYLNPDIALSITTIISALMEDSFVVFQPEQIEITTSNETVQSIFGVESLIGNIATQVGLVQRVFGLEQIKDEFAHYNVGYFEDIYAEGPYTTKLHDTIDVTFTFEQGGLKWNEVVPLKFLYRPESIEVQDEATVYYPSIYGPIVEYEGAPTIHRFMGAQRGYTIHMTGTLDQRKIITSLANEDYYDIENDYILTAEEIENFSQAEYEEFLRNIDNYLPHYRIEPGLPLPNRLEVNIGIRVPSITTYDAKIGIDWDSMTLEGGEFFTQIVIAEGMMGEISFDAHIVVTNRVIDTSGRMPERVNVSADPDSEELVSAPVVDQIFIDPYHYVWEKAIYFKDHFFNQHFDTFEKEQLAREQTNIAFIQDYFSRFPITIRFVDFDPEVNDYRDTPNYTQRDLLWYFDRNELMQYYKETDIVLTGGATFLHANFLGQIVAVQVNVESRTIIGMRFDGEEENDVYTVDMLDESTYAIPLYPTIVFAERDSSDRNITMSLKDAQNGIYVPMKWSNPVVDNPDINGTDTPFLGTSSNLSSSYIDLYRELGVGEWIFKDYPPLWVIRVDCPPKQMADLEFEDEILGYESIENWNQDIQTPIYPSYITIQNNPAGFYHVDPFNPSTARIPGNISVTFKGRVEGDEEYSRSYNVEWDLSSGLVEYVDQNGGYYRLTVNSDDEKYIKLTTKVGNDMVGYIDITLCVKILTSKYTELTFYDSKGEELSQIEGDPDSGYIYNVNTYKGFELPATFSALFGESDIRHYNANWMASDIYGNYTIPVSQIVFEPGLEIELLTTIVGGNDITLEVWLNVTVDEAELIDIIFTNLPMRRNQSGVLENITFIFNPEDITYFTIDGIRLNDQGIIDNLHFGRGYYNDFVYDEVEPYLDAPVPRAQDVEARSMYPYEFLQEIFKNAVLVFSGNSDDNYIVKDLSIHNLEGIMNMSELVQSTGAPGFGYGNGKYVIRLAQGQTHNLEIRIRFTYGLLMVSGGELQTEHIETYDSQGQAIWGETGYILGDNISAHLEMIDQVNNQPISFYYGPEYDAEIMEYWYVNRSNIPSIPVGSYISEIPLELLYDRSINPDIEISYMTERGFRIRRTLNIIKVEFGNLYDSLVSYNDRFKIESGVIVIDNLYAHQPLNYYLSSADFLPSTIIRETSDYVVTLTNINWRIEQDWLDFLMGYDYRGDSANKLIATATILGWYEIVPNEYGVPERVYHNRETISLYVRLESAEVVRLPLSSSHGLDTAYVDITINPGDAQGNQRIQELFDADTSQGAFEYREFIVFVDAYKNSNYHGLFNPPSNLVVEFISGSRHTFSNLAYSYRGVAISDIPYGIKGIKTQSDSEGEFIMVGQNKVYLMPGDDKYNITLRADLGAGQTIAIKIHFFDKTVVAVRPIIEYDDPEIRQQITNELMDAMDKIKQGISDNINILKLEHEMDKALQKNNELKEQVNLIYIFNQMRNIGLSHIASGSAWNIIFDLLNLAPELYPNPGVGELDKRLHNYVAEILIDIYESRLDQETDLIVDMLEEYLEQSGAVTFAMIEDAVIEFFDTIYSDAAALIINNKIVEYIEPQIMYQIQFETDRKEQPYVIKLKNSIHAKLDIKAIIKAINLIESQEPSVIRAQIDQIITDHFEQMIQQGVSESSDGIELIQAVTDALNLMFVQNSVEFTDLLHVLANLYLIGGDMTESIDTFFTNLFDFVEDDFNMTILAVVQEIENTISNLVLEMRASHAAGLNLNTGGRLARAVNLAIASAVNNVVMEGKIIDAMNMARNLNAYNQTNGYYDIDPYGDYIFVPTKTEIIFDSENGGESYIVNVNWQKPAGWQTQQNPNAGVKFSGNAGDTKISQYNAWENIYLDILAKIQNDIPLSIEEDLTYNTMNFVLESLIYFERLGSYSPTLGAKAQGWQELFDDPEILLGDLQGIETRVTMLYPDLSGDAKAAMCFDMWAKITGWKILLEYNDINDDPSTPLDEYELWEDVKEALSRVELAFYRDQFTASLFGQGLETQNLSLIIFVTDRTLDGEEWRLTDGENKYSRVDPMYHIEDPFKGRVSDFPNLIEIEDGVSIGANLKRFTDLTVNWEFRDEQISYSGATQKDQTTGKMGIIVTGYIKNSRVGQPVSIRLVINGWEYNDQSGSGLREYTGPEGGDIYDDRNYTIMNPINFVFSRLVDYSAEDLYQVMIKETQYKNQKNQAGEIIQEWTETVYRNVLFYPENSRLLQNSMDDQEMIEIQNRKNYILYWDQIARNQASISVGAPVLGGFSLGNAHKNRMTRSNVAYYQYEQSYISHVNATDYTVQSLKEWFLQTGRATDEVQAEEMANAQIQELFDSTGAALLVLDPLNPSLPSIVKALGTLNQKPESDLGQVRIFWNKSLAQARMDMTEFIRYMYPSLTTSEAEKSAMEMLLNFDRSPVQQQELIQSISEWLKLRWQEQNFTELSEYDYESWGIYFNHISTSYVNKVKMQNLKDKIVMEYGNPQTEAQKSQGWVRMYEFLAIDSASGLLSIPEKAALWNFELSSADQPELLIQMLDNIQYSYPNLSLNEQKAMGYDNIVKHNKWENLRNRFTNYPELLEEMDFIQDIMYAQSQNAYEYKSMSWDYMAEFFEGEDFNTLVDLEVRTIQQNPDLNNRALWALCWDRWIDATAFKAWITRQAKNILMIEEQYDVQASTGYLDGGIDGSKTVTLLLQMTPGGYIYTQTFNIRLAFLDLRPQAYYTDSAALNPITSMSLDNLKTNLSIAVKTDYDKDLDYLGMLNPYNTRKEIVFDMLDYFAKQTFMGEIVNREIDGKDQNVKIIDITNIVWNIPSGSKAGDIVYSESFTIGNVTYQSSMLQMKLS